MNYDEIKLNVKKTFNLASEGYDLPELRFFEASADFLIGLLDLKSNEKILDVCTGTGHIPLKAGKKLINGFITGIDISENMIAKAKKKLANMNNINFICNDLYEYSNEDDRFDIVTCAFGLFFFPDMNKALQRMKQYLNNEGKLVLSVFDIPFMEPQRSLFMERLKSYNIIPSQSSWVEINTEEKLRSFLTKNEFDKITIFKNRCSYYLNNAEEWWNIIMNTNMRVYLNNLSENDFIDFKNKHIEEVNSLNKNGNGIWLEVKVLYAVCRQSTYE